MTTTATTIDRTGTRLTGPPPRRRYPLLRHSLALAGRGLTKTRRNPGVLLDAVFVPVIFLLLFVYLFGGAVAGSTRDYLQYIFPGILVMTTMLTGMLATGVAINLDIKKGVFDRFRSLPIGRSAPLLGSVTSDLIRYAVSVAVLFGLAFALGFRVQTGLLSTLAAIGLAVGFGFALSWLTVVVGVLIREPMVVQSVAFLGTFPLAFGTDMVAPAGTMPGWLQAWIDLNPVSDAVAATRGLLLGGPVAGPATATLLWSAGLLAVLAPVAVQVYRRRA